MSTHPCTWASNKGRELKLSCPERVTLWQLAERAASKGFCWPSITQLMQDTGLARSTVIETLRSLAAKALIEIERVGKQGRRYKLLQPVQNKTGHRSKSEPVNGGGPVQNKTGEQSKSEPADNVNGSKSGPATGSKTAPNRFKNTPQTGSNLNPNLKRTLKEPEKGARETPAAAAAAPDGRSGGDGLSLGDKAAAPVSDAVPYADGGESKAWMSRQLGRVVHLATPDADAVTEDTPVQTEADQQRMAAQLGALAHVLGRGLRMRAYPPGQQAERSRNEQLEELAAGEIVSPLVAQEPARSPAEQIAELEGISLAEAELKLKLAQRVRVTDDKILPLHAVTKPPQPANAPVPEAAE